MGRACHKKYKIGLIIVATGKYIRFIPALFDSAQNFFSPGHDESHLNKYFIDHPPKVLSPSYCYHENATYPFKQKILALNKAHKEIRDEG